MRASTIARYDDPMSPSLHIRLNELLATHDTQGRLAADPVHFVHRYAEPRDQEVVGLVASSLAFGQVVTVRQSVARVLDILGPNPAAFIEASTEAELLTALDGFVHRVYRAKHLARLLGGAGDLLREHGRLGVAFRASLSSAGLDLREGAARFADRLRGDGAPRGLKHLLSDPRAGSACKRLLLYLRWMIRPSDGVDLGLWDLPPSILVMPLDTHVHRIARNLGLTDRADASWRTAVEVTDALRAFDPDDPVKYDFALCHMGVSRACPSRQDRDKCARCVLRDVCRVWQVS